MNTNFSAIVPAEFCVEPRPRFNVVIAYDEADMGQRARQVYEAIARPLRPARRLTMSVWKFSMLQMPDLDALALDEAARADLIVLALRESGGVPPEARAWIESWLPRRAGAGGALVVLLDPAAEFSDKIVSPARRYLRDVGRRGGLEVFVNAETLPHEQIGRACLGHTRSAQMEGEPDPHWVAVH